MKEAQAESRTRQRTRCDFQKSLPKLSEVGFAAMRKVVGTRETFYYYLHARNERESTHKVSTLRIPGR